MKSPFHANRRPEIASNVPLAELVFALLWFSQAAGNSVARPSGEQASSLPIARARSQNQKASALPRLSVGNQSANPGNPAVVPLYVTLPEGIELQSIAVEIEWKSAQLAFVSFQRGIAAEAVGADVTAKVIRSSRDGVGDEVSVLEVRVSLSEENPRRGIMAGMLAYLTYQAAKDAKPTEIELRPKLVSAETVRTSRQRISQAEVESGKVIIEEAPELPPYVNCFFFTH